MSAPEVLLSEILQGPRDTMAKLEASRSHSLRLRRCDVEDLTLTTVARAEQESAWSPYLNYSLSCSSSSVDFFMV